MKKIKLLTEWRRFLRWLRKLFRKKSHPSHIKLAEQPVRYCCSTLTPVTITAEVIDRQLDGLPLTSAEMQCRIQRALAEKLARMIIENELYTLQVHEDPIHWTRRYRATVRIYAPEKEDTNDVI